MTSWRGSSYSTHSSAASGTYLAARGGPALRYAGGRAFSTSSTAPPARRVERVLDWRLRRQAAVAVGQHPVEHSDFASTRSCGTPPPPRAVPLPPAVRRRRAVPPCRRRSLSSGFPLLRGGLPFGLRYLLCLARSACSPSGAPRRLPSRVAPRSGAARLPTPGRPRLLLSPFQLRLLVSRVQLGDRRLRLAIYFSRRSERASITTVSQQCFA